MKVVENICPVCKESNELKAIVCRHCGTTLEDPLMDAGVRTKRTDVLAGPLESFEDWPVDESAVPENGIAVFLEGEFSPMHTDSRDEFVLGRKSGNTSDAQEDLFDLSPLGGYGQGVSRRHAVIRRTDQGYEILDLGSVNGTWLNDKRLAPQKYYSLANGSHVRVANMSLFMLYRPFPETKEET